MRQIPLGNSGQFALVDDEDYQSVSRHHWYRIGRGAPGRYERRRGRKRCVGLARYILQAPPGRNVRYLNGNPLDCRRANLRLGTGVNRNDSQRCPFTVNISIDNRIYFCGHWPSMETALYARAQAAAAAVQLRGMQFSPERIRRALAVATGRHVPVRPSESYMSGAKMHRLIVAERRAS